MSNSSTFEDFYQVPDIKFDISKLRTDLENIFLAPKSYEQILVCIITKILQL